MISLSHIKEYCKDYTKIENYDKAVADNTQVWECHHKMELMKTGAVVDSIKQDLIDWGIYYDRPADELILLTPSEHRALHMKGKQYTKGKKHSEESKAKMGAAHKGKTFSDERKAKISASLKGKKLSEEHKAKISDTLKGKTFSEEHKSKIAAAHKGKHWKLVNGKRVYS